MDTQFVLPIVEPISEENIAELNQKYVLDKDRTVILFPYTHTIKQFESSFWEVMAQELKKKNYVVYTNVDGFSEQPVVGTDPIVTNFREMYYISDKIKCFVGMRQGIFDLLALTKAKILNISPFPFFDFDLNRLYPQCCNKTYYTAEDYLKPVMDYFDLSKVKVSLALSHNLVSSQSIYYSSNDILRAILNEF